MNPPKSLLFVDLDEVLITRLSISADEESLIMIQPLAEERLKELIGRLLFLTHRTRKEALQIINKIHGFQRFVKDVVAAEDIIRAALLTGQIFSLLRNGIEKRFYLRIAERKYGLKPNRFAILDDNPGNVDGILAGGGGLGLLAPKPEITDKRVTTFDFDTAIAKYESFCDGKISGQQCIQLAADNQYLLSALQKFHLVRSRRVNAIRRGAKFIRSALFRH
jgi:hypothetical protein